MAARETRVSIDFGGGSRFTVDVSRLDDLIKGLRAVRDKVDEAQELAMETRLLTEPPSEEDYSRAAIRQIIERTTEDRPGTHTAANRAYREAINNMVNKLVAARDQYAGTEGANQSDFKGKG